MKAASLTRAMVILVVDDDEDIRDLLTAMLEEDGHTVHSACDGLQAIACLRVHDEIELVLSDINMPVMSGIELSCQMAARWPGLPLLLTSGRPQPPIARPFLAKPFRWDTLTQLIGSLGQPGATAQLN